MSAPGVYPAAFRCPTKADILNVAIALLPRGRAWQTEEGGPQPGTERAFNPRAFNEDAFSVQNRKPSILRLFWQSVADTLAFLTQRLCALRLEFWCATHSETDDAWMAEYGLPDDCDPFPDLCTKVAAIGGTRCEYYASIAARSGWSISCVDYFLSCGIRSGCGRAGYAKPGRRAAAQLKIIVDLNNSVAYTGTFHATPMAGRMKSGRRLACGPDLSPLECLLGRVVHAEIQIVYEAF